MTKFLKFVAILAFLHFVQTGVAPQLERFRTPPDLNIEHNMVKFDRHMKYLVPFFRSVGFLLNALQEYNSPFKEILEFSNALVTVILSFFHCDSLS